MLGEREAEVVQVAGVEIHGVGYADVTVAFRDGVVASARLGRESIPADLQVGETVMVQTAMNIVLGIRRA